MKNDSNKFNDISKCTDTMQLSKSEIFEILQNDRRRHMLQILRKSGSQSIHSLTERIISLEGKNESDSDFRKSVYNSLVQNHIPMLMNLNVVTYEKDNEMAKLLPAAGELNTYIETTKKGDISWSHFFFVLSTIFLVGSILIYIGLFKWVTSSQWLIFMLAIFLIASIAFYRNVKKL